MEDLKYCQDPSGRPPTKKIRTNERERYNQREKREREREREREIQTVNGKIETIEKGET